MTNTSKPAAQHRFGICIPLLLIATALPIANSQNPLLPLPPNYKTTLDNPDVIVMKVHYGAHEFVPMHDHTAYPTVYVYLNDSGEVDLKHEGPNAITMRRPPTHTGAFRIAPGATERHSVTSLSDTPSDFLRVELKRILPDDLKKVFRGEAPAQPVVPGTRTEFQDPAIKIERTICPANATCPLPPAGARSLLVAVGAMGLEMNGAAHTLRAGDVMWLPANASIAPRLSPGAQCLQVVLLYP
jgi:hypothetical protein